MKTLKTTLALAALAALPMLASAAVETYPLDPTHTYPSFAVEHWGLSMMHGRFDKTTGKFAFDRAAKTGSTELTIDTASLTTGDNVKGNRPQSRDDHLRSADFFNTKEFPTMTFKSTKVNFSGELPSGARVAIGSSTGAAAATAAVAMVAVAVGAAARRRTRSS